ncbi:MAG: ester cyclase [Verrucomicrobia bacterium]|nr:ester cyclase [Verrucomicrobiota bacterium]
MSETETRSPKEVITRWFTQVWNKRAEHLIDELMTPDAAGHLEGGKEIVGTGDFRLFQKSLLDVFPDLEVSVLRVIAEGEDTCLMWEGKATHSGVAFGLKPTQKSVVFRGTSWFRVVGGKIVEGWDNWNQGALISSLAAAAPEEG